MWSKRAGHVQLGPHHGGRRGQMPLEQGRSPRGLKRPPGHGASWGHKGLHGSPWFPHGFPVGPHGFSWFPRRLPWVPNGCSCVPHGSSEGEIFVRKTSWHDRKRGWGMLPRIRNFGVWLLMAHASKLQISATRLCATAWVGGLESKRHWPVQCPLSIVHWPSPSGICCLL